VRRTQPPAWRGAAPDPGRPLREPFLAAAVVLAALFLAHGLQCVAAQSHGPTPSSQTSAASAVFDGSMPAGHDGVRLLTSAALPPVAGLGARVSAHFSRGHLGVVCVAVLAAGAICWLRSPKWMVLVGRRLPVWPPHWASVSLRVVGRWRPPLLNLALLCVSRT